MQFVCIQWIFLWAKPQVVEHLIIQIQNLFFFFFFALMRLEFCMCCIHLNVFKTSPSFPQQMVVTGIYIH